MLTPHSQRGVNGQSKSHQHSRNSDRNWAKGSRAGADGARPQSLPQIVWCFDGWPQVEPDRAGTCYGRSGCFAERL
jgi:hypothetical protein